VSLVRADWDTPLPVTGVRLSLWRAASLLRVITLVFCLVLIVRWRHIYAHPAVASGVGAAMIIVTGIVCVLAVRGRAHRRLVVGLDLAVTIVLTLASVWAQSPAERFSTGMPTLTTLWAAGPVIEVAYLSGWVGGIAAALIQFAAAVVVRDGYDGHTVTSGVLLLTVGAVTGYVAALVVRAENELSEAVATRVAVEERERLAASIHDGVLQILGLVHRRGNEAGGDWGVLAEAAAEQESALRHLVTSAPVPAPAGQGDLADALRALASPRVTISAPGEPVMLPAPVAQEMTAAVRAALDNVAQHAGSGAKAWVLLEALENSVRVVGRDDGTGIAAGRLAEAARLGRLGVTKSITGRVRHLGGHAHIESTPGDGTVVELNIPAPQR
jgi:signal transduction histidine kinase